MIKQTLLSQLPSFVIAIAVLFFMLIFFLIGIRLRKYFIERHALFDKRSFGVVESSLLGLLALLLAFTFSMSSSRHDRRLEIIIEEANTISTAVLRADLYPDSIRKAFRHDFKAYVISRIEFFEAGKDTTRIYRSLATSKTIQQSLWDRASGLGRDIENIHRTSQMIPALNAMFDIVTTRNAIALAKVPELIIFLLFILCFSSAFILGYTVEKKPDWIIMISCALMFAITIYMIIDLDRSRGGFIKMTAVNEQIVQLLSMFGDKE